MVRNIEREVRNMATQTMTTKAPLKVALCTERHLIPYATDGSVFPRVVQNPLDIEEVEKTAESFVRRCGEGDFGIDLFVTGLSTALAAVIKAAGKYDVPLRLYHYDKESNSYRAQNIIEKKSNYR